MSEIDVIQEADALVEAGVGAWLHTHWECPCGTEQKQNGAAPVLTIVSLRVPACPFCGGQYREEFRRP